MQITFCSFTLRPCSGTAVNTEWISNQPPHEDCPALTQSSTREDAQHALHCLCLVNESFHIPYCQLATTLGHDPPLKTVMNKLGDSYQTYINTYKTHAMATYHRGAGQPLDKDPTPHAQDTDILSDYHHEDMDNFENVKHKNHTTLKALTRDLDDLQHRVETAKGQPTEAISCLECELHRLSLVFHSSAPAEPHDDVLQQYMESLCSAQKQTTLVNTLIQDMPTFNGSDSTQLEDWLVDIETQPI